MYNSADVQNAYKTIAEAILTLWHIGSNVYFSVNYSLQKITFPEECF